MALRSEAPASVRPTPQSSPLQVLHSEPGYVVAMRGPLMAVVWTGGVPVDVPRVQAELDAVRRMRATTHRDRLLYAFYVGERAAVPDGPARTLLPALVEDTTMCVGILDGQGLRAALLRAVTVSITMPMSLLTRSKVKLTTSIADGSRVLAAASGGTLDEMTAHATLDAARRLAERG